MGTDTTLRLSKTNMEIFGFTAMNATVGLLTQLPNRPSGL